jgi:hypothetical protein
MLISALVVGTRSHLILSRVQAPFASRFVLVRVDLRMRPGPDDCEVLGGVMVAFVTVIVFRLDRGSMIFMSGPDFVTVSGRISASDTAVGCVAGTYSNAVAGGLVIGKVPIMFGSSTCGGKIGPI